MSFEVKISDRIKRIAAVYDEKLKEGVKKELEAALEQEATLISKRTQEGNDVEGAAFDPYKPSTRAMRKRLGKDFNKVTLRWTGQMMRSMRSKVQATRGYLEGTLFFLANQRNKARWNNELRHFFGLSKEQVIRITARLRKALK